MVNKTVRIISDNENYIDYMNKDLIITDAEKDQFYNGMYLCDLEVVSTGETVSFSLYEYEVEEV